MKPLNDLQTVEAKYKDLLQRLGVQGHEGAIAEIEALRNECGLNVISDEHHQDQRNDSR